MKVSDLISHLKTFPEHFDVWIPGREGAVPASIPIETYAFLAELDEDEIDDEYFSQDDIPTKLKGKDLKKLGYYKQGKYFTKKILILQQQK